MKIIPAGIDAIASLTRNNTKSKNAISMLLIVTLGEYAIPWGGYS